MCRAIKVLCVAGDADSLRALRMATTAAEWELTPGATDETDALGVIDAERPHALVAFGEWGPLVSLVRARFPATRIVTDRPTDGSDAVASSLGEGRDLLRASRRPVGPVR